MSQKEALTIFSLKSDFKAYFTLKNIEHTHIVDETSIVLREIHQLRFIHVLLYLSRKKGIRAIHLKEALFNIATKTTIFVEKNVITCNIADI
jgi:hypothetical protein